MHEDEVMGVSLNASLAAEEAAEQAVLAQLRNRAACLENDLLRQALDGLAPNSKVPCCTVPHFALLYHAAWCCAVRCCAVLCCAADVQLDLKLQGHFSQCSHMRKS